MVDQCNKHCIFRKNGNQVQFFKPTFLSIMFKENKLNRIGK